MDHIKKAIETAFDNNVSEMQSEIQSALQYKIASALEQQKTEIAKSFLAVRESAENVDSQENIDETDAAVAKGIYPTAKSSDFYGTSRPVKKIQSYAAKKTPDEMKKANAEYLEKMRSIKIKKEDTDIQEKLTKDMPASKVIDDFVHSDDPKFKGKSKKERIKMALGAFYSLNPSKSKNEENDTSEKIIL